ncbi:MAG: membrane protein insertase YidC [Alphaproteobacteria bacterium]|nr:membrane protein insertase YidC [Alphaproteobacteria bacterium]
MNNSNNNIFLAIILSFAILIGFQHFYGKPQAVRSGQTAGQQVPVALQQDREKGAIQAQRVSHDRAEILKETPRIAISTPQLSGSINLKGAKFDDLLLTRYRETADKEDRPITLLSPSGAAKPKAYYAEFNWLSDSISIAVPSADTVWKADGKELTPDHSVRMTWNNGEGQLFERTIAVDDQAMFTVTERVTNSGKSPVTLYPFGIVARQGTPAEAGRSGVVLEGGIGVLNGTLEEFKYKKMADEKKMVIDSTGGWLGVTDKYWLVAMVPPQDDKIIGEFVYNGAGASSPADGFYQVDFRGKGVTVLPGSSVERVSHLFAGAKRVSLLDTYAEKYNIPHFDKAIDFGWFYFLTKPFLFLLTALEHAVGHMGVAILLFTILLKLVTLPLSQKSYHSMARMKAIQPEIKKLQERFANDKAKLGQEMMDLYKREKVNPLSGCVPTLIQIPIFFALYKVLYVNIEMRGASFFGWIRDMSMPDPTSWFNLFGLAPWGVPSFFTGLMHIGAWPILMGISMLLQQKLSPQPPDKSQARAMTFMPIFFTYLLSNMPAGLVIYWTWSNLLGILQQWYIMRGDLMKKPVQRA